MFARIGEYTGSGRKLMSVCVADADKTRIDEHIDWKIKTIREHLSVPNTEISDRSRFLNSSTIFLFDCTLRRIPDKMLGSTDQSDRT